MMGISTYCPELGGILEKICCDSLLVKTGGNLFTTVIRTVAICWYNKCVILLTVVLVSCKLQICPMIPILCKLDLKGY